MLNPKLNIMKIVNLLIIAIFATTIISCSSDNSPNYSTELRAITNVDVNDSVSLNKNLKLDISYEQLGSCDEFAGFDMQLNNDDDVEDNTYTVVAVSKVFFGEECKNYETPKIKNKEVKLKITKKEPYHFQFWQSNDTTQSPAVPKFLEKTVYVKDMEGSDDTDE